MQDGPRPRLGTLRNMEFPTKRWIRPERRMDGGGLLDRLFAARGLSGLDEREAFCRPSLLQL